MPMQQLHPLFPLGMSRAGPLRLGACPSLLRHLRAGDLRGKAGPHALTVVPSSRKRK